MSKSRGNVVDPWDVLAAHGADAFRWYYLTTQQPWAGYRFSLETVGESVRQFMLTLWNTYSFWVLYANAEGLTPRGLRRPPAEPDRTTRPLGALPAAGHGRHGARAHGRLRLHHRRAGDRRLRRGALQLVRAALARGASGRATGPPSGPCATACWRPSKMLAPFTPFLADEIYRNLVGGAAGDFGDAPRLGPPARLPGGRRGSPRPRPGGGDGGGRRTVRLGHAARARGEDEMRQPLRRAVIVANEAERAAIEALADLVTAELNVKELDFVSEEGELVKLHGEAELPGARPALRQAHAAGGGGGGGARPGAGRRARWPRAARSGSRSTATTTRSAATT